MPKFFGHSVIFDLDGTLVDTAGDLHGATNHVLHSLGRDNVPLSAVKADVGFGALTLIKKGLSRTGGIDGIDLEQAKQTFLAYYIDNIAVHSKVFPGGLAMLETLTSKGISIGVCTNKPYALAVKLLHELDLSHFFKAVIGGDSFSYKKPDPRHILETAARVGTGPYVMVGDASPDILGAQAAGIPVIAAAYGYPDMDLKSLKPDAIIQTLGEVEALLVA